MQATTTKEASKRAVSGFIVFEDEKGIRAELWRFFDLLHQNTKPKASVQFVNLVKLMLPKQKREVVFGRLGWR
jgi:hypothetical protein